MLGISEHCVGDLGGLGGATGAVPGLPALGLQPLCASLTWGIIITLDSQD